MDATDPRSDVLQCRSMSAAARAPQAPVLAAALGACIVLPWLNPFASGPSPAVVPWLVTLACAGALLVLSQGGRLAAGTVALAWLVAALASSAMGLLQYLGLNPLAPFVNATGVGEAFANLRQRNQFASLTSIGLAALLWCSAQPRQASGWRADLPLWLGGALLALGNAASSSRTGAVQLLLLAGMHWAWPGGPDRTRRALLLVAALAYGLGLLALPRLAGLDAWHSGLLLRLSEGDALCSSRVTLWSNVLQLIRLEPWTGWGWGNLDFAHYISLFSGARFCDILDNAHNLPLQIAVELGVPAALLLCGAAITLAWRSRPWAEADPARQLAWAVLAVIALHSLLEYPLWYGPFQMALWLSLWILWSTVPGAAAPRAGRLAGPARLAFAGMLLAFVGYASWDYRRISQIYLLAPQRLAAYREDTMDKIRGSWLFQSQVAFAELTITPLAPANAAYLHALATELLHFSPEARVIEKLIESALLLGLDQEARFHMLRYQAAFPQDYARWAAGRKP